MILLQSRGHPNSRPGKSKIGKGGREGVARNLLGREPATFVVRSGYSASCVCVCLFYFYKCPSVKAVCGLRCCQRSTGRLVSRGRRGGGGGQRSGVECGG